jgi:phosphoenolpyruvate carboxylase
LKRRLTFKEVDGIIAELEEQLYQELFNPNPKTPLTIEGMLNAMGRIREILIYQNNGLFLNLVDNFISKIRIFGFHFATLDLRQDSSVHTQVLRTIMKKEKSFPEDYESLTDKEKIKVLSKLRPLADISFTDELVNDTLASIRAAKTIFIPIPITGLI